MAIDLEPTTLTIHNVYKLFEAFVAHQAEHIFHVYLKQQLSIERSSMRVRKFPLTRLSPFFLEQSELILSNQNEWGRSALPDPDARKIVVWIGEQAPTTPSDWDVWMQFDPSREELVSVEVTLGKDDQPLSVAKTETIAETSGETTDETIAETSGEATGEATAETSGEATGEATAETSGEATGEATAETSDLAEAKAEAAEDAVAEDEDTVEATDSDQVTLAIAAEEVKMMKIWMPRTFDIYQVVGNIILLTEEEQEGVQQLQHLVLSKQWDKLPEHCLKHDFFPLVPYQLIRGLLITWHGSKQQVGSLTQILISGNRWSEECLSMALMNLRDLQQFPRAEQLYDESIEELTEDFWPPTNQAVGELGNMISENGRKWKAYGIANRCIRRIPNNAVACHAMAVVLKQCGNPEEAFRITRKFYDTYKGEIAAHHRLAMAANLCLDSMYTEEVTPGMRLDLAKEVGRTVYLLPDVQENYESCQRIHRQRVVPRISRWNDGVPLRVGVLSNDLRNHPCGHMLMPLLENVNARIGHFYLYSVNKVDEGDYINHEMRRLSMDPRSPVTYRDLNGETVSACVQVILQDNIDILLDMSGHTRSSRHDVIAAGPAPLIVNYFAYPSTTGIRTVTHKITDYFCNPRSTDKYYTEQLLRLPRGFQCYWTGDPKFPIPTYRKMSDPTKEFVLGCFNNTAKFSARTIRMFARILRAIPHAKLILGYLHYQSSDVRDSIISKLQHHGIPREQLLARVEMKYWQRYEYLEQYNRCHLVLDTYPYNGGTISSESLMMSTPFVTLAGTDYVSRVGVSLLSNLGYPELIAETEDQYVEIVVGLSRNAEQLKLYHDEIRVRMNACELANGEKMSVHFWRAFRRIWEEYLKKEASRVQRERTQASAPSSVDIH